MKDEFCWVMKLFFIASGNSIHSYKWVKYFSSIHEVFWFSVDGFDEDFSNECCIRYIDGGKHKNKFINLLRNVKIIRRLIEERRIDLIHVHYVGFHALLTYFTSKVPLVLTLWGSELVFSQESMVKKRFLSHIFNRSRCITCDAYHMKEKAELLIHDPSKIKIINFGIDTHKFTPMPLDLAVKKSLGISSDKVVISNRNHEPVYDIQTLINAAPLVLEKMNDVVFVIAASGSLTETLKSLVRSLKIEKNVIFTGRYNSEEMQHYLSFAKVYVSTALSDGGIAASTAEAMSCGKLCIVTDVMDNHEWISNKRSGWLFRERDSVDLSRCIIEALVLNEKDSKKISKAARQVIVNRNDYCNEMMKMESIYQHLNP